ncbi:MAG: protein kinase, partial [Dehalococcoidia bacterium]
TTAPDAPTLTEPLTSKGTIVGTFQYMAPEQLEGKEADARTDIFAFGAVLYEMATGERAFDGTSRASLITSIMSAQPRAISELQPMTPPALDHLVQNCLTKDADERIQTAHDVRLQLQWIAEGGSQIGAQAQAPARRKYAIAWLAAGVVLGMLIAFGFVSRLQRKDESSPADSPAPVVRSVIDLPETAPLAFGAAPIGFDSPLIALSPDGTQLVYVGESDNGPQLYRRDMAGFDDPEPIPGTEGAIHPFFSPDGQWVGFLTHNKLRKVSVRGGDLQTLCEVRDAIRATWTLSDMIYFGDDQNKTIRRVPASGGEAEKVVNLVDSLLGQVLPDGRSALLTSRPRGISLDYGDILLLDLDTLETKALIDFGYDARYVPTGHLLFARGGNLLAAAFDLGRREVRGEPAPVVRDVSMDSLFGQVQVAVSDHGTLAFISGGESALGKMSWIDREGNEEFLPVEPRVYGVLDLSSDDTRLAVHVADVNDYIWIYDFRRREGRRLIGAGNNGWPVWTADGDILAFSSGRFGQGWRIMSKRVDGPEDPRELFSGDTWVVPASWSPDGRVLAFFSWPEMRIGFLSIGMEPAVEWVQSAGAAGLASFSPDGRWMAYISDETGRLEVWVRSYPDGSIVRQLSVGGGHEPVWCRACDELFYRNGDTWYASKVTLEPEFDFEPPRVVFKTDFIDTPGRSYDISADGQRLIVVKRAEPQTRTRLHVISNWFDELKRLVPTGADE